MAGVSCEGALDSVGQQENARKTDGLANSAVPHLDKDSENTIESRVGVAANLPLPTDADPQNKVLLQPVDAKAAANGKEYSRSAVETADATPSLKEVAPGKAVYGRDDPADKHVELGRRIYLRLQQIWQQIQSQIITWKPVLLMIFVDACQVKAELHLG